MKKLFSVLLCISMVAFAASCGNDPTGSGGDNGDGGSNNPGGNERPNPSVGDNELNRQFTDAYMSSHYLWNEEYNNTVKDFDLTYNYFLQNSLIQLYRSGVNLLDGYQYEANTWRYYTYIERYDAGRAPETTGKNMVRGFGMNVQTFNIDPVTGAAVLLVKYVYPGSPADAAGITRGTLIGKVNGQVLTEANFSNYINDFVFPHTANITRALGTVTANTEQGTYWYNDGNIAVQTGSYYENPIVFSQARLVRGKRIGYVVCVDFNSAYNQELIDVFQTFQEKGVTDIILDLRYNGGGDVDASALLASLAASSHVKDNNQVFAYYRYNNRRMIEGGYDTDNYKTYPHTNFDYEQAHKYNFNFNTVYVITTADATSPASELLINALKGIDVPVKIAGCNRTTGQNVGVEPITTPEPVKGYDYVLAPVTFQAYNAKGNSDYSNGFAPDITKDDYDTHFPVYDWGYIGYLADRDEETGELTPTDEMVDSDYFLYIIDDIIGGNVKPGDFGSEGEDDTENEVKAVAASKGGKAGTLHVRKLVQPEKADFRKRFMYLSQEVK